jgi:hypothetical protein
MITVYNHRGAFLIGSKFDDSIPEEVQVIEAPTLLNDI